MPKEVANRINRRLENLMPFLTPTGVTLGFLFPAVFVQLRPFIPLLFGAMTLSGAIKLRAKDLGAAAVSPIPVITFFVSAHVVMPFVAFFVSRLLLPNDPEATAGFVLLFSIPTAAAGFIWVSIFRGDGALALALLLLDTLLAPFVVPLATTVFLGTSVSLDPWGMAVSLGGMIVFPTILGVVLNEASRGVIPREVSPYLAPLAKMLLVLVVSANAAAVAPTVDFSNARVWAVALTGLLLAGCGFALGRLMGFVPGINEERKRSLVFTIGLRNISAAATLAIAFFPEAAALPAILGMIFQQTLAAVFGRILLGKPGDREQAK
jgi:BASS family bile acid:Na+ symporter